ncbi:MAG: biotin--[acetyl-CoA-carboxylase] ligase [Ligilactobacillus acidipiscis]|jgi:BirA family biotin operon repressor/biotin-[acetyl-CoA-carboxylase] ligase|nr:biotin--[acetyl-CoA-carboxylase] ligase [Ligilactobacillus acidipiscis]MCI1953886.1 biotin--[acetyl-CoA-carboxylase] ligase [Ligilactobacillus acidipiscis]
MKTTDNVLKLLENNTLPISGQQIADNLHISRTAIWKAIKSLRENGYEIKSKPHVGYLLLDPPMLSEAFIRRNLTNKVPLKFELHDSLGSTNLRAKELGTLPQTNEPQIVISDQQTKGYGRYGRSFASPKQTGIYLSILLQNQQKHFDAGLLTTATATALCRAIEKKLGVKPGIKWVNDVLWKNKKVSGILTEGITDIETGDLKQVVIGIGINYLTDPDTFTPELQQRATSLRSAVLAKNVSRNVFIAAFLDEFFNLYPNFNSSSIIQDYRKYCTTLGKRVTITQGSQTTTGTAQNITDTGELVLNDGRIFSSGEITKIRSTQD